MNKTEFFVLVCDYIDAVIKANETGDKTDENFAQNHFLKLKAFCLPLAKQAREKLAKMEENKEQLERLKNAIGAEEI